MDHSTGYESVAQEFLARRGRTPCTGIGAKEVRSWARGLSPKSSVIDIGCGPGFPLTAILVEEKLDVFAVDGSAAFVAAFQRNLPGIPILCEPVQTSKMFDRTFGAALSWGLIFLLKVEDQHRLIQRFSEILVPGGRLLFTAPAPPCSWIDVMTNLESVSLGADEYRKLLAGAGLTVSAEYEDEGQNHYFDAIKSGRNEQQIQRSSDAGTGKGF
ncbi:MAG: class I SAM-dependent methyltransferase [Acidobacteria bacterium]|nr:class I SAM-dependent methyltransferase [Acidobacteriota bacterium]